MPLSPGLQQHPAASQADPVPCGGSHSLQNVSVTHRPAHSCVSCSPPRAHNKGTSAAVGLCLDKAKQRLPTDQYPQHPQMAFKPFQVLAGGLGRVQTPNQAMDSPEGTQGVVVSPGKPQNGAMTEEFWLRLWGCKPGAFAQGRLPRPHRQLVLTYLCTRKADRPHSCFLTWTYHCLVNKDIF